jgi:uncharacterized protein (TIGR02099 family)
MKRLWRAIEILAWAAFFAFAALVLALRFWLLPGIEQYREHIVAAVSRAVGAPVKIGAIEAGWLGLRPQVNFYDVRLYDAQGREALALPAVENVIAWRSLLVGGLRLHSLAIDRPRLGVRRDAAGALYVAGVKLSDAPSDHRIGDWLLDQEEIVVRDAEVEWIDEKRGAPPLALSGLELRLRNAGSSHSVGFSARPPAALGTGLEFRAELSGRSAADLQAWNGRAYLELGYTDLAVWRDWIDYPVDLREGLGALRVWLTLTNGEPAHATADVTLAAVAAQLDKDLPLLELASVTGRLEARRRAEGYEVAGSKLILMKESGTPHEPLEFRLEWRPEGKQPERGVASAKQFQLEPFAQVAGALPLPADVRQLIKELEPRGRISDATLEWSGKLTAAAKLTARARFAELAIKPRGAAPGFSGLSGSVDATEARGSLRLATRKAELELPHVFPGQRLPLDALEGQVDWERVGERGVTLRSPSLAFANEDAEGKASGSYAYTGEGPGTIDLTASFSRATTARIGRYLPSAEIMGEATRAHLAGAILGGESKEGSVRLKGDLREFPFVDPAKGEFQVAVKVEKGRYEYAQGWPRVEDIEADLLFQGDRLEIVGRSAAILGAKASGVRVAIPSMLAPNVHITVNGQAEGPTSEFFKFIESSPVQGMIGNATEGMLAAGRGRLRLKLDLPLADLGKTKVAGDYEFSANSLIVHAQVPPLERAAGRLSFTESRVGVHDVTGRVFGGAVTLNGGTRPDKSIEIVAKGDATVAGLRTLFDHPWRRYLSGSTSYSATVTIRDGRLRVGAESSLRGVASALPPPAEKTAADALPLRVEFVPSEGGARDRLSLLLDGVVGAEFLRRRQGGSMVVQRLGISLSPAGAEPARLPERPGTLIYGPLASLDLDRWLPLFEGESGGGAEGATTFDVKLGVLDAYGKRIHGVTARGGLDAAGWSANLQSDEVSGDVSYASAGSGKLVARLTSLRVPDDYPGSRTERAKQLPAVDLAAERFIWRDKNFGRVEIKAQPAGDDWRIEQIAMANPEATLSGTGVWRIAAPALTSINFSLDAADAGGTLARLGYPGLVLGGKARMQGALSWSGDPNAIDYPTLSGDVQLQAEDGQFLEIDPGFGKLISLMSLQALPRRLTLDFRDVFSKGFSFDRIRAAGQIERGIMTLKDFTMEGSAADASMAGEVDLIRETQNLKVRVVPSLGDTAAAVVAVVAPLFAIPLALAQRALKDPLGNIFAFQYAVTGSWSAPTVTRIGYEHRGIDSTQSTP